jgi:hypothetical protein
MTSKMPTCSAELQALIHVEMKEGVANDERYTLELFDSLAPSIAQGLHQALVSLMISMSHSKTSYMVHTSFAGLSTILLI